MCDFETTTDSEDCRIWAWGVCEIENPDNFEYGNTIEGFFEWMKKHTGKKLYFHNLKFDGEFIIHHAFKSGYHHILEKHLEENQFRTLISDKGMFYQMKICFGKTGKKPLMVTIIDSLKILPFSVAQIAKTFKLPMEKGEIDYNLYREPGHILTTEELYYLKRDVQIVAMALDVLFKQGLTKITQGGNALEDYKNVITKKVFEHRFSDTKVRPRYTTSI